MKDEYLIKFKTPDEVAQLIKAAEESGFAVQICQDVLKISKKGWKEDVFRI